MGILFVADEDNCSDGSLCADGTEGASVQYVKEKIAAIRTLGEDAAFTDSIGILIKPDLNVLAAFDQLISIIS